MYVHQVVNCCGCLGRRILCICFFFYEPHHIHYVVQITVDKATEVPTVAQRLLRMYSDAQVGTANGEQQQVNLNDSVEFADAVVVLRSSDTEESLFSILDELVCCIFSQSILLLLLLLLLLTGQRW